MAVTSAVREPESAWRRASRDLERVARTIRFVLLTVVLDVACAATAALAVHDEDAATGTVALAAAVGAVGGTVLALALTYLFQLERAPLRQRDEAWAELAKSRRPAVRSTFAEAAEHAKARIEQGYDLADRLAAARTPDEVTELYLAFVEWEEDTWRDMDAHNDYWAVTFGTDDFEEMLPSDSKRIVEILSAKLARLHTLARLPYEPIDPFHGGSGVRRHG